MSPRTQIHQPRGVQIAGLRNTTEGEAKKEKPACTEQLPSNLAAAVCALHTPRASARRWQGGQTHPESLMIGHFQGDHTHTGTSLHLDPQPPQFTQPPQTLQITVERGRNTDGKLAEGLFLAPDK